MIDFTKSPDFMDGLKHAILEAMRGMEPGGASGNPTVREDPVNVWLTTRQTLDFLELSASAFHRLRQRLKEENKAHLLCVSYALGTTEPRYQFSSLQALMADGAVGGSDAAQSKITNLPNPHQGRGQKAA